MENRIYATGAKYYKENNRPNDALKAAIKAGLPSSEIRNVYLNAESVDSLKIYMDYA